MSILHYKFDEELSPEEQSRVKEIIENAFRTGEIVSCRCAARAIHPLRPFPYSIRYFSFVVER